MNLGISMSWRLKIWELIYSHTTLQQCPNRHCVGLGTACQRVTYSSFPDARQARQERNLRAPSVSLLCQLSVLTLCVHSHVEERQEASVSRTHQLQTETQQPTQQYVERTVWAAWCFRIFQNRVISKLLELLRPRNSSRAIAYLKYQTSRWQVLFTILKYILEIMSVNVFF